MSEKDSSNESEQDTFWWTPYAVLAAIVVVGLLGYLGKLDAGATPAASADDDSAAASDAPGPAPSASAH